MTATRRQFLDQAGALAALLAVPAWPQEKAPAALIDKGFARVVKLADGVYATVADGAKGPQALSNGGVIAGRNAVLIVEGHMQPAGAALEVEAAKTISRARIRGALDTHYHLDHSFGNSYYQSEGIPILAHESVAALMKERYAALKGVDKAPLLAPIEQRIARARSAAEKQHAESDLGATKFIFDALEAATLAYPTEALAARDLPKKIALGGLTAVIEHHPGHTSGDLIVRVPERDVVFTGDLLFNGSIPVTFDANMTAWRKVLDRFEGYGRRTQFVPGHGPVCGVETVREQAALFDDLRAHAEKMRKAGTPLEDAQQSYLLPERFRAQRMFAWGFTVGAALEKYYAEL